MHLPLSTREVADIPKLVQPNKRRFFFARLLGLASLPVAAKVAAALPVEASRAIGGTETSCPFLGCIIETPYYTGHLEVVDDPIPYGSTAHRDS
jgi:hypothetical protein